MTAIATSVTPATSQQATEQLAALEREPASLREQIRAARQAEARGEAGATPRRAQLELEADELEQSRPDRRAELTRQLAALKAREQAAREEREDERQRRELEAAEAAVTASLSEDLGGGLQALARGTGKYRRRLVELAGIKFKGDPELQRQLVEQRSGAGNVTLALERIAGWLRVDPRVRIDGDLAVLDRVTGDEGKTLRLVRDAFFGKD
jgi:hypothetical protein